MREIRNTSQSRNGPVGEEELCTTKGVKLPPVAPTVTSIDSDTKRRDEL